MPIEIDSLTRCFHNANKARCCFTVFFFINLLLYTGLYNHFNKRKQGGTFSGNLLDQKSVPAIPQGWGVATSHSAYKCNV